MTIVQDEAPLPKGRGSGALFETETLFTKIGGGKNDILTLLLQLSPRDG